MSVLIVFQRSGNWHASISKSFNSTKSRGGEAALLHGPGGEEAVLFGDGEFAVGLFLLLGHGGSNILQRRTYLLPPDFERRVEVRCRKIVLLVLFHRGEAALLEFLRHDLDVELANAVAHDVQDLLVFLGAFVVLLHDALEAAGELDEEVGAGVVLLG